MLQPNLYHGKTPWNQFEGWYIKIVDKDAKEAFSFIPGIFWGKDPQHSHSFLQALDGKRVHYTYHQFNTRAFIPKDQPFQVKVDQSSFSLEGMSLNINTLNEKILGTISFSNVVKWQDHPLSPGSMGFFNFIPFMQCYSQICALDMDIKGTLLINGIPHCFDGGRGYIEKNWGNSFPYSWIWIQSNHFSNRNTALTCSIGHVPFWFTSFRGFLVGLLFDGTLYKFTTMNRSTIQILPRDRDVEIVLNNKDHTLILITKAPYHSFIQCNGPRDGRMIPLVQESLQGSVSIQLFDNSSRRLIVEDLGLATGIEYGGDQMKILD